MDDSINLPALKKGLLTFEFNENRKITLSCLVDKESGYVEHDEINFLDFEQPKKVYVKLQDGTTFPFCLECHSHLIKPRTIEHPELSGNLEKIFECSSPVCLNKM
ncbi:hypothetical protein M0P65_05590 [Candidatus Gracilibacteria bacterium]|nr:hypothetical protein [Candidatus Gracilibacteria bacterium]